MPDIFVPSKKERRHRRRKSPLVVARTASNVCRDESVRSHSKGEACCRLAFRTGHRKAPVFNFHELPRLEALSNHIANRNNVLTCTVPDELSDAPGEAFHRVPTYRPVRRFSSHVQPVS